MAARARKLNLDDSIVENLFLRITLPQAIKILCPVGAFVICNHAYVFLEVLD
jgi:hypothetical protein